jgi:hypothetical protein
MKTYFTRLLPRYEDAPIEPAKPEAPPTAPDKFIYKRDGGRSLRQIVSDVKEKSIKERRAKYLADMEAKEKEEEKPEIEAEKEEPAEKVEEKPILPEAGAKEEAPTPPDPQEIARVAAETAAQKVAAETKASFKEEIDKILNKDKDVLDKQKDADELIAVWDKEGRLPKDWKEIATEQMRISDAKWEQRMKAQPKTPEAPKTPDVKTENDKKLADYTQQVFSDIKEINNAKLLPTPNDINEINNPQTTDEAAKEIQKVIAFGIKLNTERVKANLAPVMSFNKIFFLHYLPSQKVNPEKPTEVPGKNAPVAGVKNTPQVPANTTKYIYARDHNKSMTQIAREVSIPRR